MSSGPHEGASVLELSAELVAPPGTPLLVGVRGVGEWTLSYGDETYAFATALLPGESAGSGLHGRRRAGLMWSRRRRVGFWWPGW